ncbi:MAG: ATP-binding protein [Arenicellales bacterium]
MTVPARRSREPYGGIPDQPVTRWNPQREPWRSYFSALGSVVAGTAVALLFRGFPLVNLALFFLVVVVVVASNWGRGPSLLASLVSFLAFNYLFTVPYYTLRVDNRDDVLTLAFFLVMAVLAGNLAARMHNEMTKSKAALARVSALYSFSRRMAAARTMDDVLQSLCDRLSAMLECAAAVLAPDEAGELRVRAVSDSEFGRRAAEFVSVVRQAWNQPEPTDSQPSALMFLKTAHDRLGAVVVERSNLTPECRELAATLCEQAGAAVERVQLVADLERARLESETERLRSALLSSVSHDLRTPLASIIGSSSSLIEYGEAFSVEDRRELLATILEEARRLDRYIQNLLDMTRLGQGGLSLRRDWVDLNDLVADAIQRLAVPLKGTKLEIDIAEDAALLHVHGVFIEQVLINLLENAARYSQPNQEITIDARRIGDQIVIDVIDQGPGIPEADREKIFEMFQSAHDSKSGREGAGLGLAICRGLIGAHGGAIEARPGPGGKGACLRVTLPYTAPDMEKSVEHAELT